MAIQDQSRCTVPCFGTGSAVVATGVKTHICYANTCPVGASLQNVKLGESEWIPPRFLQQELEQKLHALAGVLRQHVTPRIFIKGVSKVVELPSESESSNLQAGKKGTTGQGEERRDDEKAAEWTVDKGFCDFRQCIVFADTQDEVRLQESSMSFPKI